MSKFSEAFEEVKAGTLNEDGKPKAKTFKRDDFDTIVKGLLNTPDYKAQVAKVRKGELSVEEIPVTEKVRKLFRKVLVDFGVDKAEAESVMDTYEFTTVDGLYELISEAIYKYIETGKKFDFLKKEDFQGSLLLKHVEEGVTEHRDMRSDDPEAKIKQQHKAHKLLVRESKTPDWLKTRL